MKKNKKLKLEATIKNGITFNLPGDTIFTLKGARAGGDNESLIEYIGNGFSVVPIIESKEGNKLIALKGKITLDEILKFHGCKEVRVFVDVGVVAKKSLTKKK